MEAHECHSASSAVVVLHAYPSMALKGNSNSKQQAAKLKDAFLGSSKVFNRSHPMVDTHRVLVKLNAPWSDAGASSRIPTRKPRDPMTISNSSYCPADPLSVAVSGGETCKIHVEVSKGHNKCFNFSQIVWHYLDGVLILYFEHYIQS